MKTTKAGSRQKLYCAGAHLILTTAVVMSSQVKAAEAIIAFNIPQGDLSSVINAIAAAGGTPVAFPSDLASNRRSGPIIGRKTVRTALTEAVAGSGLIVTGSSSGTFSIRATKSPSRQASGGAALDIADIDVSGEASHGDVGFQAGDAGPATRLDAPIKEIPLSVTAVTSDVLKSENVTTVADAVQNVAGVVVTQNGTVPQYQIRGFNTGATASVNGAQSGNLANLPIDDIERIEVLKGPTSILTGVTNAGGGVNITTKAPTENTIRDVTIRLGSYGYKTAAFDLGGYVPQTEGLTYRFNISGNVADHNYAGYAKQHENLISPAINWKDHDTSVTFGVRYYDTAAGSPPQTYIDSNNNLIPVARGVPQGNSLFNAYSKVYSLYNYVTHDIGTFYGFDVAVENKVTYEIQNGRSYVAPFGAYLGNNQALFYNENFLYLNRNLTEQADVTVQKDFGWFKDKIRIGFDYTDSSQGYGLHYATPYFYTLDLTKGLDGVPGFPSDPLSRTQHLSRSIVPGVSFTDKIDLFDDRLHIFGTVRQDHFGSYVLSQNRLLTTATTYRSGQSGISWTAGGAFDVTPWMTVYGNRNLGFTPQVGQTSTGSALPPSLQDQAEVGARYYLFDKKLTLTTSFYNQTTTDVAFQNASLPGTYILIAGQTSRGFEFEAQGEVFRGLNIVASFADQHVAYDDTRSYSSGQVIGGVPQFTGSLWTTYTLQDGPLSGLYVGAGAQGISGTSTVFNRFLGNVPGIPGYVVANFGLGYQHDRYSINAKLNNAFNKTFFYSTIPYPGQPIFEGQQRNFLITAKYSF